MISVIIPAYNSVRTIERAVRSAISSDDGRISEIVIVDDASTDGTYELINELKKVYSHIVLHRNSQNQGPSKSRNTAIELCRGCWIAILDSDDAWTSDRLRHFDLNGEKAEVFADNIISYDAIAQVETGPFYGNYRPGVINIIDLLAKYRDSRPFDYGYLKPILKRSFLLEKNIRYNTALRQGEDYALLCEIALNGGRIELVDGCSYVYTTWFGAKSRVKSPYTSTVPDGFLLASELRKMGDRYRLNGITQSYLMAAAIKAEKNAPAWKFYYLLTNYDIKSLILLICQNPRLLKAVFRELAEAVKRLLRA